VVKHALRRAFAVAFLESHPGAIEPLQALMNHSRVDTTQVYLRALNRSKQMEAVRDLSWSAPPSFCTKRQKWRVSRERPIRDSNPCRRRERAVS